MQLLANQSSWKYLNKTMNNSQDTNMSFVCPVCGNKDHRSIGILNGKPYCRRCISFRGEEAMENPFKPKFAPININYELSEEQTDLSKRLLDNYKNGIDSLVYAVTGSGKTEICLKTIKYCLNKGLRVGFAVPRRSVCLELKYRFQSFFQSNKVIAVFGGNHKTIEGDIVCLTTHQLFRYKNYFDLLIMDEIDAFPYKGNEVLEQFFKQSIKGNYVLLTATPSDELIKEFKKKGKTIILTSHHKEDIDNLCDEVLFMEEGRLVLP